MEAARTLDDVEPNEKRVPLLLDDKDRVPAPWTKTLREHIRAKIETSLEEYVKNKQHWKSTVGYEGGNNVRLTLSFQGPSYDEIVQEMARFAVRLRDSLPVTVQSILHVRYGVVVPDHRTKLAGQSGHLMSDSVPELGIGEVQFNKSRWTAD